jgi:hypothetical protein
MKGWETASQISQQTSVQENELEVTTNASSSTSERIKI